MVELNMTEHMEFTGFLCPSLTLSAKAWRFCPSKGLSLPFPSVTEKHTHVRAKLHEGEVVPGGYLPGILQEKADGTAVPVCHGHVLFECAPGDMDGPIVNLKASNRERPVGM